MTLFDNIRDTADALTEPHVHVERIREWDANRNPKWRTHQTTQPGLLTQLYESVIPAGSNPDGGRGIPSSRPPLALEALGRHMVITIAVTRWCWSLRIDIRSTVESNIRALVGKAPELDDDTGRTLLGEMRQWRHWCAVLTGWERLYQPAGVPCPVIDCGQVNTLRINLTNKTAMCKTCGSTWDDEDGGIFKLADHIRIHTDDAA